MRNILLLFTVLSGLTVYAQNPKGFDKMAKNMAGTKAPFLTKEKIDQFLASSKPIVFLDSREESEFLTSHLSGAIWIGYDAVNWSKLENIDKNSMVVIYCSVGYRSGKLTEQLIKKGYTNVFNLYGGLFNWVNNGGKVTNKSGKPTSDVHGYNKNWSKWINTDRSTVVL